MATDRISVAFIVIAKLHKSSQACFKTVQWTIHLRRIPPRNNSGDLIRIQLPEHSCASTLMTQNQNLQSIHFQVKMKALVQDLL